LYYRILIQTRYFYFSNKKWHYERFFLKIEK
jgi:hypothetical protein